MQPKGKIPPALQKEVLGQRMDLRTLRSCLRTKEEATVVTSRAGVRERDESWFTPQLCHFLDAQPRAFLSRVSSSIKAGFTGLFEDFKR